MSKWSIFFEGVKGRLTKFCYIWEDLASLSKAQKARLPEKKKCNYHRKILSATPCFLVRSSRPASAVIKEILPDSSSLGLC